MPIPSPFNLFYTDSSGSGIPIVFVHGFPFDHSMWDTQVEALTPSFRVITYDQKGYGKSKSATTPYPFEFYVDDFFALLEHLALPRVIACGLSMGGYVVLRAFERNPSLFKALVLSDTRSEADSNEAKIKRSVTIKAIYDKGVSSFSEGFLKGALSPLTFEKHFEVVQKISAMIAIASTETLATTLLAMASRTDVSATLASINVPVLSMVGELDTITPPAVVESMSQRMPHSSFYKLSGAGHVSNMENSGEFNDHLADFLTSLPKV